MITNHSFWDRREQNLENVAIPKSEEELTKCAEGKQVLVYINNTTSEIAFYLPGHPIDKFIHETESGRIDVWSSPRVFLHFDIKKGVIFDPHHTGYSGYEAGENGHNAYSKFLSRIREDAKQ